MRHDLTTGVMTGLGWYYLLAAILNTGAVLYVGYMEMVSEGGSRLGLEPRTRKVPSWLFPAVAGLYGLAVLILMAPAFARRRRGRLHALSGEHDHRHHSLGGRGALRGTEEWQRARVEPKALNSRRPHPRCGAWRSDQSSLVDDRLVGCGLIFQVMGVVCILDGRFGIPDFVRSAIDAVSGPTTFFVGATLGFAAMVHFRKAFANGVMAWGLVNAFLLFFGLSMTDFDFRDIVTKPDNVPIVGMLVLVGFFTWLSLRRAVINDERMARGLPNLEELEPEKVLTWPDLVYTELICMVVLTIVLVVWAIALRAPLEQPASSTTAPNPSKAPWYFLGLQEMLVYFDPWMAGVVLPSMIIVGLMAIPYIDTNKKGNGYYTIAQRKFAYVTFQYGFLVLWVMLILLGTFLRGPNWNFFGPYEYWDLHRVIPLNNINLSDIFWIQLLGTKKPDSPIVREWPGLLICFLYFAVVPPLLGKLFFKKVIKEGGMIRYATLAVLILFMASLPIKMVLRWTINLKYLVAMPEYFFNI